MKFTSALKLWLVPLVLVCGAACACAAEAADTPPRPFVRGSQQLIVTAHMGKPFVIAFWSATCTNCRDDLELFGKLKQKYRNFDLVLVATDTPEQNNEIAQILQRYHLEHVDSWVFADSFVERLRYEVDAQWYGELPRTYFYDAQGHAVGLSGSLEPAQVEGWILKGQERQR